MICIPIFVGIMLHFKMRWNMATYAEHYRRWQMERFKADPNARQVFVTPTYRRALFGTGPRSTSSCVCCTSAIRDCCGFWTRKALPSSGRQSGTRITHDPNRRQPLQTTCPKCGPTEEQQTGADSGQRQARGSMWKVRALLFVPESRSSQTSARRSAQDRSGGAVRVETIIRPNSLVDMLQSGLWLSYTQPGR